MVGILTGGRKGSLILDTLRGGRGTGKGGGKYKSGPRLEPPGRFSEQERLRHRR